LLACLSLARANALDEKAKLCFKLVISMKNLACSNFFSWIKVQQLLLLCHFYFLEVIEKPQKHKPEFRRKA